MTAPLPDAVARQKFSFARLTAGDAEMSRVATE
jgi:hypothetical protein